ncbi:uroporphyrinogen-III synthase [Roseobacter sp. EG26]|uniref:uroporphyrinogen-III synthase n=1 Tax=Roseobacter sp. EG26 TaxID=3412477 RepID=UPI003CE5AE60
MGHAPISLILTRPAGSNERFLELCPPRLFPRFQVIHAPLIEISATGLAVNLGEEDNAIFTSANGVKFAPAGAGRKAYCVGAATTRAAAQAGWISQRAGEDAGGLISFLEHLKPEERLVHLSGVHTRGQVAEKLGAAGFNVDRVKVYDQKLMPLTAQADDVLRKSDQVVVPLFSPRTAAHFAAICPASACPHAVFLSESVSAEAAGLNIAGSETAENPDAIEMWQAIEKMVARITLG